MQDAECGLDILQKRVDRLERNNRTLASILTGTLVVAAATILGGWMQAPRTPSGEGLRTRGLIIEDATGTPRIVLGSPMAERNMRGNPRTGMIINDAAGVERFALGLNNAGTMVMGFDAPPGKGDDRNRERVNIVADGEGGAAIRLKDRRTSIAAQLILDDRNNGWLEFLDVQPTEVTRRRFGFKGEQTVKEPR